jgi:hypothetical protein
MQQNSFPSSSVTSSGKRKHDVTSGGYMLQLVKKKTKDKLAGWVFDKKL